MRIARQADVKALVEQAGLTYPVAVYLRVFKAEREVELWASGKVGQPMVLLKRYVICAASGEPGPERVEGDLQVPEGLYQVSQFNPTSNYHLALKVDYPNGSDRRRSDRQHPGGLIYMQHGRCEYRPHRLSRRAHRRGVPDQRRRQAQAGAHRPLPARLSHAWLEAAPAEHRAFWAESPPAFEGFEARSPPNALQHRPKDWRLSRWTLSCVAHQAPRADRRPRACHGRPFRSNVWAIVTLPAAPRHLREARRRARAAHGE